MKGVLTRNQEGVWLVKWSDLHSFSHGTQWSYTELSSDSNSIKYIKDGEIRYKPLEEGLEVEFEHNFIFSYAKLIFPEVDSFEKEQWIKEYVKNSGKLFTIGNVTTIRDGGTIDVFTSTNTRVCCIHKDNWTLHYDYPTTDENIITDKATQVYIMDRFERYKKSCEFELKQINTIIEKVNT